MDAWFTDILALLQDNRAELWEGLVVTLQLWAISGVAGLVLALSLALGATHGGPVVRRLVRFYGAAFRGTPLLVQVFLTDMDRDYDGFNAVWDAWLPEGTAPSRACVEVKGLAKPGWKVELVVTAAVRNDLLA